MPFRLLVLHVESFAPAFHVEVNIADGTYELHPTPEEEAVADLHHAEVEPVPEQAEDQFGNSECEGKPRIINSYV